MFFLSRYRNIEKPLKLLIAAEFFVQLVNSTFLNLQPLYMKAEGFNDGDIADFISWRYAGVLALAVPLGIFIRGKKLRSFFYLASIGVPAFALIIIYAVHTHNVSMLVTSQCLWGACFTFIQIPILPFILRHCSAETETAAISLSYSTWSLAGITSALLVYFFNSYDPVLFNERNMLAGLTIVSFLGIFCVWKMKITETELKEDEKKVHHGKVNSEDWRLIGRATFPALIIATGAGLTIPFINLFFSNVHQLETNTISLWNFVAAFAVAFAALMVPRIKETVGYRVAIPMTQSFAVISLVLMATTELYKFLPIASVIAVSCYILRQPLMNMAGPMTSEIAMKFVGKKNQEITSALMSAIWSGSWFISTRFIFGTLRRTNWPYVDIFLITAALYAFGIFLYVLLIRAYTRRQKAGLIGE